MQMQFSKGDRVTATLLDGNIKDAAGEVLIGCHNSKGEPVYLVEMKDEAQAGYGRQTGSAQLDAGHPWVLSLYGEEIKATQHATA